MTVPMRVAVVGLGAAGLAAALAAAERGATVVGFEQSDLDNQPASSGGRGKIIRFGYDDAFYAGLMRATLGRWETLATRSGRRLMSRNGGLHIGDPTTIDVVTRGIVGSGNRFEEVGPDSARLAEFGAVLNIDGGADEPAVFEPTAGVMWPGEVRAALADAARRAGASLLAHIPVTGLEPTTTGSVAVRTGNGVADFDRVILSGGPWAFRLAPAAADAFAITRRFQAVIETDGPIGDGRPRPWIDHAGAGYYGMINVGERTHVVGLHELDSEQPVRDPAEPDDREVRARSVEGEIDYVIRRFCLPSPPTVVDVRACHYTSTESRDFVIDDCPRLPGVILLSPCSGHGFKFAITVGQYAAALVHGESIPDRDRFRLKVASKT